MIVKVQVSLATSEPVPQVLIYNEDRSVEWQGDADDALLRLMRGRPKAFFKAHVEGTMITIDRDTSERAW